MTESTYTDAQANEILRTAVRLAAPGEITFEEMVKAAAELGISRDELKEAEERFKHNTSEAGLIAEFKGMQVRQFASAAFHILLFATIAAVVVILDLPEFMGWLLGLILVVVLILLGNKYWNLRDFNAPRHQKAFNEWKRKKDVWLRPEQAKALVDKILHEPRDFIETYSVRPPEELLQNRLREKMGYDRRRAREVVEAYLRENPDFEMPARR